jgi:hypothetical protein
VQRGQREDTVLNRVVNLVSSVVQCDSCFIYVLEQDTLVLRWSHLRSKGRDRPQ